MKAKIRDEEVQYDSSPMRRYLNNLVITMDEINKLAVALKNCKFNELAEDLDQYASHMCHSIDGIRTEYDRMLDLIEESHK